MRQSTVLVRSVASDTAHGAAKLYHRKRVLAADTPEGIETLRNVLEPAIQVFSASSMRDAFDLLRHEVDLLVCGIHFDNSRMFDVLRIVKSHPAVQHKRILCYRDRALDLPAVLPQGLTIACTAMGAIDFVDLHALKQQFGARIAHAQFLAIVLRCLSSNNKSVKTCF